MTHADELPEDDGVFIEVDITPRPVGSPSTPVGGGTPTGSEPTQGWLAVTGFEPTWLAIAAAVLFVALGVALVRSHRQRR